MSAGQALDRLNEAHVIEFHQEANRRAVRAAAEAVIETLARADGKRRRFFVMKRAAGLEFAARFLELHAPANDLDDVGAGDQIVDEILRNQSGHSVLNVALAVAGSSKDCSCF